MTKEQKTIYAQGVLIQQALPSHPSRFSIKRIAFTLRRGVNDVKAFLSRDGTRGHAIKTPNAPVSSSSLSWTEGENRKVSALAELYGDVTMTIDNGSVVFTSETGAHIRYHQSGAILYSPAPLRRQQIAEVQKGLAFWQQDKEVINNKRIELDCTVASEPEYGQSKNMNTPYGHFRIGVDGTDAQFDVYAYKQGVALLKRRGLRINTLIHLEATVHVEPQYQPGGAIGERRWLRFFDGQKR
jgi:hypothetical protein